MKNLLFILIFIFSFFKGYNQSLTENFDDIEQLEGKGWTMLNLSQPLGITNWFQGNSNEFAAYNGAPDSYISANYNNVSNSGTISNWLITPTVLVKDGDKLSFWTKTPAGSIFNDRLEVRMSTGQMSLPVSTSNYGSFTNVMTIINDDYDLSYPTIWEQFVVTVSGVGNFLTPVNFGFHYNVINAGPNGQNGNYIGIDKLEIITEGVYTITVSPAPAAGGSVTGGGIYSQGDIAFVSASPNPGYTFKNWQENGTVVSTNRNYSFSVNANRNLVAKFKADNAGQTYTITTKSTPVIGGTTTGDGEYAAGKNVKVKAVANPDYVFESWMEGSTVVATTKNYSFTAESNRTIKAKFVKKKFQITTKSTPAIGGTTTGDGEYAVGKNVKVKAEANPGFVFESWMEGSTVVATTKNYNFTASANRTLKAKFVKQKFLITTKAAPAIGGTTSGDGEYVAGKNVKVKAVANPGYVFESWTEGGAVVSTTKNYTFTADAKRKLVAKFSKVGTNKDFDNADFANTQKQNSVNNELNVYPNPFNDFVTIDAQNKTIQKIGLYDFSGRLIKTLEVNDESKFTFDTRTLSKGTYLLMVQTNEGNKSFKVFKK